MIPRMMCNIRMETEEDFQKYREYLESMPMGLIEKWHDSWGKLPSEYIICDGEKGTPDLRIKGQPDKYYIMKEIKDPKDIRIAELEGQLRVLRQVAFNGPKDYAKIIESIPKGFRCAWYEDIPAPNGWRKLSYEENMKISPTFIERKGIAYPINWYMEKL